MSKFAINSYHAVHTGKTKSYQIWYLRMGESAMMVKQWGKAGVCTKHDGTGGQHKFEPRNTPGTVLVDVEKEKIARTKRDYDDWKKDELQFSNKADFLKVLKSKFGNVLSDDIYARLQGGAVAVDVEEEEEKPVKKGKPKEPEIDRSTDPTWGTW